jgi:hypothetical protein
MKTSSLIRVSRVIGGFALVVGFSSKALAHCDTLDGPVVKAAQRALAERDVNLVLIWVQPPDEAEIKRTFGLTLSVRDLGGDARKLADHYFYETLVRIHRAGEGAPYTGLKAAGTDHGPAVRAGDKALETRDVEPVQQLLAADLAEMLKERFREVLSTQKFSRTDVDAGRAYVRAYVSFIHYVENVYQALTATAHPHPAETPNAHPHGATTSGQSSLD